jgi:predicted alpha/beta hydrolase family esterase
MSAVPTLIVPGFQGSGPEHWQTWLESQLPDCTRIDGINWHEPVLAQWAGRVREVLAASQQPLRIIAHSFGCLASVVAAADRPEQISQLVLVAPADGERFDCMGLKPDLTLGTNRFNLSQVLPTQLQVRGLLIASRNDPWMSFDKAAALARQWSLALHDAGSAGHINPNAGYGPWPALLPLLATLAASSVGTPNATSSTLRKGRGSALAAVRQLTREQMQSPQDHRLWQGNGR